MPRVDRPESPPEDWGPAWAETLAWERGYVHSPDGLVCRDCGALVPSALRVHGAAALASAEERHDEWHERLAGGIRPGR